MKGESEMEDELHRLTCVEWALMQTLCMVKRERGTKAKLLFHSLARLYIVATPKNRSQIKMIKIKLFAGCCGTALGTVWETLTSEKNLVDAS